MSLRKKSGSFFALFASFAVSTALAHLLAGCGPLIRPAPEKPDLYRITGRVADAQTRQGLPNVRVLLRVTMLTDLGPRALVSYGYTGANGSYSVEVSEGFEVVRQAVQIRLEASGRGYKPAAVDLPPPANPEKVYPAPDILLAPGDLPRATTLPPGVTIPGYPTAPGPATAPGPPAGPRILPPRVGGQPKKPPEPTIPWK
jgi:hypothetical protein